MKKFKKILSYLVMLGFTAIFLSSCVKQDFDQPVTANLDPNMKSTMTIMELRNRVFGSSPILIDSNVVIDGIIVADDQSGSFYKEITIQDSTGGIAIQVDMSNFYSDYPIGRHVFVKCKGLYVIRDSDGNFSLGVKDLLAVGRIPQALVSQYVIKGKWGQEVKPVVVAMSTLISSPYDYTQRLVKLYYVEMDSLDAGSAWGGDPVLTYDNNRNLNDCNGNTIIVYTSSYANFANHFTPSGNGAFTGVFSRYSGDGELVIRTEADVATMTGTRCNGMSGTLTAISIDSIRKTFTGSTTVCPIGRKIKGIVISDYTNANTDPKNVVLQDSTGGIVVRFKASHSYQLGAEIEVNVGAQELSEFHGLLEVNNVPNAKAVQSGTGTITPRVATISEMLANYDSWESTLLTVMSSTITNSTSVYSGNGTLTDASGNIILFTRTQASFANTTYPTGTVNVTGILGEYSSGTFTPQFSMRNTTDVQ